MRSGRLRRYLVRRLWAIVPTVASSPGGTKRLNGQVRYPFSALDRLYVDMVPPVIQPGLHGRPTPGPQRSDARPRRNVQDAASGTAEVAVNIVEVSAGAGETGSASSQVFASAKELSCEGSKLKIEVDKFLATARAA
jgi:hypothetical protein